MSRGTKLGHTEGYLRAEEEARRERIKAGQETSLRPEDLLVGQGPGAAGAIRAGRFLPRAEPAPRHQASIDYIGEHLFQALLATSEDLAMRAREGRLEAPDHVTLQRSIDGFVKLARLQLDREKAAEAKVTSLSDDDLREELARAAKALDRAR